MNEYLQNYQLRIKTLAPVFIGDGGQIGNREYIYMMRQKKVIVPDISRLYESLSRKGLEQRFEEYMMGEKYPLGKWLRDQGFSEKDYDRWKRYELDAGDFFLPSSRDDGRTAPPKDIKTFVKDPYGMPYIPGSSMKGVIRTSLLAYFLNKKSEHYRDAVQKISSCSEERQRKRHFLENDTKDLEKAVFHTLRKAGTSAGDAVNSIMSGLIVSDSRPVQLEQLTLCQKIDLTIKGGEKKMPILREALKPGTIIEMRLSINKEVFPLGFKEIEEALDQFNSVYYERFGRKFDMGNPEPGVVWLGGGVGFGSKTVINAVFNEPDSLRITDRVFQNTVSKYREHHHDRDRELGVSPHVYKCTQYQGNRYDMGMAKIVECREI